MTATADEMSMVAQAALLAVNSMGPEKALHGIASVFFTGLGDREAHLLPEALTADQHQFFVAGAFLVTPDRRHLMLVGNHGFPPEQKRLLVPIDGGNPGQVIAGGEPLLLADTTVRSDFRQYLNTARMGRPADLAGRRSRPDNRRRAGPLDVSASRPRCARPTGFHRHLGLDCSQRSRLAGATIQRLPLC